MVLIWIYDRKLDPMIQITYVNTTQQFADTLTKGSLTRDGHSLHYWLTFHDARHIHSKQVLFCGCESFIFQHEHWTLPNVVQCRSMHRSRLLHL